MMDPSTKRLYCRGCDEETRFDYLGENTARRPVWSCSKCGTRRPGFFTGVDPVEVAADGGDEA